MAVWRRYIRFALLRSEGQSTRIVPPAGCINDGYNGQRCPGCESLTLFDPRRSLWPPSSTPGSSAFCFCSE
ncbi:hypothetical protein CLAIMM_09226 [Cladophialophora immunda]|nr:hypothetical protein CLAIMM_09226 [Cladophialophora immunda]